MLKRAGGLYTSIRNQGQSWSMWDTCLCGGVMAAGKTPFIGCQSLLAATRSNYRARTAILPLMEVVTAWKRFLKDTVLLFSAPLTLRLSLKLSSAAAEPSHQGGSLSMQASISVRNGQRFTAPKNNTDHVSTKFLYLKSSMVIPKLVVPGLYFSILR